MSAPRTSPTRSDTGPEPYGSVRALRRGLDLLAEIGRGTGTVKALAEATGLNRTSIYRLLSTLEELGYVERLPSDGSYRLTTRTYELSAGVTRDQWIMEAGSPILRRLSDQLQWPANVVTHDSGRMLVRESTHRRCPTMVHEDMAGRHLPMLSSLGRVYLAFCGPEIAGQILQVLNHSVDPVDAWARDPRRVGREIRRTQTQGWALCVDEIEPGVTALSVPVRVRGDIVACMNVVTTTRVVPVAEVLSHHLPALRLAAGDLEQALLQPPRSH
jgi:IclR family transcriptional regulator, mhp operon transcriptional activator